MTQKIIVNLFTANLFQLFEETFEQVHGIYLDKHTSLFETLETISAAEASRATPHNASIAAHVEHLRYFLEVGERFFLNQEAYRPDWSHIWRTVKKVTPQEWTESKKRLKVTYERLLVTLQNFDIWDGEDAMGDAMALVVHSAYHLGEIRQMLTSLK